MQLETEEPSHGTLSPGGYPFEYPMYVNALVLADTQRSAVHETYTRALSSQHFLHKQREWEGHLLLQFNKTVIGDQTAEEVPPVHTDILKIEVLEAAVAGGMEHNQYGHYL